MGRPKKNCNKLCSNHRDDRLVCVHRNDNNHHRYGRNQSKHKQKYTIRREPLFLNEEASVNNPNTRNQQQRSFTPTNRSHDSRDLNQQPPCVPLQMLSPIQQNVQFMAKITSTNNHQQLYHVYASNQSTKQV